MGKSVASGGRSSVAKSTPGGKAGAKAKPKAALKRSQPFSSDALGGHEPEKKLPKMQVGVCKCALCGASSQECLGIGGIKR